MTQQIKYKRVLLKLSGESLMGSDPFGINHDTIVQTVGEIAEVVKMGVQVGIVVGTALTSPSSLAAAISGADSRAAQRAWIARRRTTWA